MLTLRTATLADVWRHMLAGKWQPGAAEYDQFVTEALAGRMYAGIDGRGEPLALGGVFSVADGAGHCWLSVVPALVSSSAVAVLKMRRVLARERRRYPRLVCVVRDGNVAGVRMALALGFLPTGRTLGRLREWERHDGRHRRRDHRREFSPPGAPGAGGAGCSGPAAG